jgi:hypothetical protein
MDSPRKKRENDARRFSETWRTGITPLHGIHGSDGMTLGMFIADAYTRWIHASRPRTAANTLEKLHRHFITW